MHIYIQGGAPMEIYRKANTVLQKWDYFMSLGRGKWHWTTSHFRKEIWGHDLDGLWERSSFVAGWFGLGYFDVEEVLLALARTPLTSDPRTVMLEISLYNEELPLRCFHLPLARQSSPGVFPAFLLRVWSAAQVSHQGPLSGWENCPTFGLSAKMYIQSLSLPPCPSHPAQLKYKLFLFSLP